MSEPYTRRFFLGPVPGTWEQLFTVPAGEVYILRDIELYAPSAGINPVLLSIQATAGPSATFISFAPPAGGSTHQWVGRVTLETGDQLWGNSGGVDAKAIVTGYQFDA